MKKLLVIAAIILLFPACAYRPPPPSVHLVEVEPHTQEGKECVKECRKIRIMEMSLAVQRDQAERIEHFSKGRGSRTFISGRGIGELGANIHYGKCFRECGGTWKKEIY